MAIPENRKFLYPTWLIFMILELQIICQILKYFGIQISSLILFLLCPILLFCLEFQTSLAVRYSCNSFYPFILFQLFFFSFFLVLFFYYLLLFSLWILNYFMFPLYELFFRVVSRNCRKFMLYCMEFQQKHFEAIVLLIFVGEGVARLWNAQMSIPEFNDTPALKRFKHRIPELKF